MLTNFHISVSMGDDGDTQHAINGKLKLRNKKPKQKPISKLFNYKRMRNKNTNKRGGLERKSMATKAWQQIFKS